MTVSAAGPGADLSFNLLSYLVRLLYRRPSRHLDVKAGVDLDHAKYYYNWF
jgi:hypothetical protein